MNDNQELQDIETPKKDGVNKVMNNKKDKKNIILFSVLGAIVIGLTSTCLGFGFSIINKEPELVISQYKDGRSGCYDENGKVLKLSSDCFKYNFAEKANCYLIDNIESPELTSTVVLSEIYQSNTDTGRYLVKGVGYSNGENNIFSGNTDTLKTVISNTSYLQIGAYSLSNIPSLENVTFGSTSNNYKMYVCHNAFENDTSLTTVNLGNALYEIESQAFLNCTSLESIEFASKIEKIGSEIFKGCTSLKTIVYQNTKTRWEMIEKDENWLGLSHGIQIKCVDAVINLN